MSRYRGLLGLGALALLLGFLTQAGVGALWYVKSIDRATYKPVVDSETKWHKNVQDGIASTVVNLHSDPDHVILSWFAGDDTLKSIPRWAQHYVTFLGDHVGDHDGHQTISLYASGWPKRSMSAMSYSNPATTSPSITHGFVVGELTRAWLMPDRPLVLP